MEIKTKIQIRVGKASRQTALEFGIPDDLRDTRRGGSHLGCQCGSSAQRVGTIDVIKHLEWFGLIEGKWRISLRRLPKNGRCGEFLLEDIDGLCLRPSQRVRFKAHYLGADD